MPNRDVEIGADGIDVDRLVEAIHARVETRMAEGAYATPEVARAERMNLANLNSEDEFLSFYLECLRDASVVDINDFEIIERRAHLGRLLVALKRSLWKLLKFYTYRLWSQQNLVNGLLVSAVDSLESRNRDRIGKLEARIAELEAKLTNGEAAAVNEE